MPIRRLLAPWLVLSAIVPLLACDLVPGASAPEDDAALAERPEGWESLEDQGSALRLYYQFVDSARRVRFVERLEDVPEALRGGVGFVKMEMAPPLTPQDAQRARRASRGGGPAQVARGGGPERVILYSARWCGACRKAKRYLEREGVDFEVRDIDTPAARDELVRKTGRRAIPVLDVDGRILTGFSPKAIDALLRGRA